MTDTNALTEFESDARLRLETRLEEIETERRQIRALLGRTRKPKTGAASEAGPQVEEARGRGSRERMTIRLPKKKMPAKAPTKKPAFTSISSASLSPTRLGGSTAALPGLENPVIEEVSNAALTLWNAQLEAGAAKKRVEVATEKVQTVLASHNLTRYRDSEHELFVEIVKSKAKVKLLHGSKKKRGRR